MQLFCAADIFYFPEFLVRLVPIRVAICFQNGKRRDKMSALDYGKNGIVECRCRSQPVTCREGQTL